MSTFQIDMETTGLTLICIALAGYIFLRFNCEKPKKKIVEYYADVTLQKATLRVGLKTVILPDITVTSTVGDDYESDGRIYSGYIASYERQIKNRLFDNLFIDEDQFLYAEVMSVEDIPHKQKKLRYEE